jgi:hypothetical protein
VNRTTRRGGEETAEGGWLEAVRQCAASLRFGKVEIVVHDGKVVQIETTEKIRLEQVEN